MKKTQGHEKENPFPNPVEFGTLELRTNMLSLTQLWPGRLSGPASPAGLETLYLHMPHKETAVNTDSS